MEKKLGHRIEAIMQFLARLYGPLLVMSLICAGIFALFVADGVAPLLGWTALPIQVAMYYVADLLTTHRRAGRLITTFIGPEPSDTLWESQVWLAIAVGALITTSLSFAFYSPWYVPFLIVAIPNGLGLTLFATDGIVFPAFEQNIFDPFLKAREKSRADRRQQRENEKRQYEEEQKEWEEEQRQKREREAEEERRKPKPFTHKIDEKSAALETVVEYLRGLRNVNSNVDPEVIEQAIEAVQGRFGEWLVDSAQQEDSFGASYHVSGNDPQSA